MAKVITEGRKEAAKDRVTYREEEREGNSLRFMTIKLRSAVFELETQLKLPKVLLIFRKFFAAETMNILLLICVKRERERKRGKETGR